MPSQDPAALEWGSHLAKLNIEVFPTDTGGNDRSRSEDSRTSKGLLTSMGWMNNVLGDMAQNLKAIHTTNVQEAA